MQATDIDFDKYGGRNPIVEMAHDIAIDGTPHPEDEEIERLRGERLPDGALRGKYNPADPPAGTLESFMRMFGSGGLPGPQRR